jgi:ribosomal protein L11 methyltransferase
MYRLTIKIRETLKDELSDLALGLGAGSVSSRPAGDRAVELDIITDNPSMLEGHFSGDIAMRELSDEDWKYRWMEDYHGCSIGDDIVIIPYLSDCSQGITESRRYRIFLDPRDAFGDGMHPTTALCMMLLHELLEPLGADDKRGLRMLDAGTGTGVIAILGSLMDLGNIDAIDIEEDSAERARFNCRINAADGISVSRSDLASFNAPGPYDIIVANLLSSVVTANMGKLISILKSGGTLIISGISRQWDMEMRELFSGNGLILRRHEVSGEWNCYVLKISP